MKKITNNEINQLFESASPAYVYAVEHVGIWDSELSIAKNYFRTTDQIVDIGCGAGRTSFGLYDNGFKNIIGIDITQVMIDNAIKIKQKQNINIQFVCSDIIENAFDEEQFDAALFSFNGLMQIPTFNKRKQAMLSIFRILKPGAIFFFTTHDRDSEHQYKEYWNKQRELWESGSNNPVLHEFGDRLVKTRHEPNGTFVHHPDRKEILQLINNSGFDLIEDFLRDERFIEPEEVKSFSGNCRFWIVQKPV